MNITRLLSLRLLSTVVLCCFAGFCYAASVASASCCPNCDVAPAPQGAVTGTTSSPNVTPLAGDNALYTVVARPYLYMREGPGMQYATCGQIPYGTTIAAPAPLPAWPLVTYRGNSGYVNSNYLNLIVIL